MPYDRELAQRVRVLLGDEPFAEKAMFGGLAFLVHGHMAVAVGAEGDLMVRVDRAQLPDLLTEPGTDEVVMGQGRVMRGWLRVEGKALADEETLGAWVTRGLDVVDTLPPK